MTAPLSDPDEVRRRRRMRDAPHMAVLRGFAAGLRAAVPGAEVPDADPLDGGAGARLLLLLEKPGPGTSPARGGSGFVSCDNPDPTAAAVRAFAGAAGMDRRGTVLWNACPWWNGTIRFTAAERRAGLAALPGFLDLLPGLRGAICVGRQAGRAAPLLRGRGLAVWECAHPSPQVRAASRAAWDAIPGVWAQAWRAVA